MRVVHAADLHLGFRQFDRMTPAGINVRERDVALSFERVIDQTIALAPDMMVIGGDIFHQVRASNVAIKHAYAQFARLRAARPATEIVMVAGNHDANRTAETGSILGLFRNLGMHVVDGAAQVLDFPALDCAVLAVPDNHHARPVLEPTGVRRFNILLLHGEAGGIGPTKELRARELTDDDLHTAAWDYVALGHYHVYREVAPNCYYSGSIDYTSTNIWGERVEEIERGLAGKGIIERDLRTGAHTFHPLPPTRAIRDLAPISALGLSIDEIDSAVRDALESIAEGIDGAIVRLRITDLPRGAKVVRSMIDRKMIREYSRRALNLQVDLRSEEVRRTVVGGVAHRHRAPLDELLRDFLTARTLAKDVDRDELLAQATYYLEEAGDDKAVLRNEETAVQVAA